MKKLTILLIVISLSSEAQITFEKILGNNSSGNYIEETKDGGFISCFDSVGSYVVRLDQFGNYKWNVRPFIFDSTENVSNIGEDLNGGYMGCGSLIDTANSIDAGYFFRLDSIGNIISHVVLPIDSEGSHAISVICTKDSAYAVSLILIGFSQSRTDALFKIDMNGNYNSLGIGGPGGINIGGLSEDSFGNYVYGDYSGHSNLYAGVLLVDPLGNLLHSYAVSDTLFGGIIMGGAVVGEANNNKYIFSTSISPLGSPNTYGYLIRLDSTFNPIWTKLIDWGTIKGIVPVGNNGFALLVNSTLEIAPGVFQNKINIFRIDENGDSLWTKSYIGLRNAQGSTIRNCSDGGLVVIGNTSDSANTSLHGYVIKTDSLGRVLQTISGSDSTLDWTSINPVNCVGYSHGDFILTDDSCNTYVTGYCPTPPFNGDILTIKYDLNGDTIWTRRFLGSAVGIKFDNLGNLVIVGNIVNSNFDWLILKYAPNGNLIFSNTYNNAVDSDDVASCFDIDPNGNIVVVGHCYYQGFQIEKIIKYNPSLNIVSESPNSTPSSDQIPKAMKLLNDSIIFIASELYSTHIASGECSMATEKYKIGIGQLATSPYVGCHGCPLQGDYNTPINLIIANNSVYVSGQVDTVSGPGVFYNSAYLRFDLNLNRLWDIQRVGVGPLQNDDEIGMDIDSVGNIYIATPYSGTILSKYSPNGNQLWTESTPIEIQPIVIVKHDSIYLCGRGRIIDSTGTIVGSNFTALKYDANGFMYSKFPKSYSCSDPYCDYAEVSDAAVDHYGNVYMTGTSNHLFHVYQTIKFSSQSFDNTLFNYNGDSLYVNSADYYQWYKDTQLIAGANSQGLNIISTGNGNYYCKVVIGCDQYDSDSVLVTNTNTKNIHHSQDVIFYPNPAKGKINYRLHNFKDGTSLEISDCWGRIILRQPLNSSSGEVQLNYSSGIYFIKVFKNDFQFISRIIIE